MRSHQRRYLLEQIGDAAQRRLWQVAGFVMLTAAGALAVALSTWSAGDPSLNHATGGQIRNLLGAPGAAAADLVMQLFGFGAIAAILPLAAQGLRLLRLQSSGKGAFRLGLWFVGVFATAATASLLPATDRWPLPTGLGGVAGDAVLAVPRTIFAGSGLAMAGFGLTAAFVAILAVSGAAGLGASAPESNDNPVEDEEEPNLDDDEDIDGEPGVALISLGAALHVLLAIRSRLVQSMKRLTTPRPRPVVQEETASVAHPRREPVFEDFDAHRVVAPPIEVYPAFEDSLPEIETFDYVAPTPAPAPAPAPAPVAAPRAARSHPATRSGGRAAAQIYELPAADLLAEPKKGAAVRLSEDVLADNARLLEGVLDDFSVRGEIINARPGPVVTLYELEPAPGVKSSRVIGLADDIARSMSAISARVAVVPGRNAIGIELPNQRRETVYLRELIASSDFMQSDHRLAIALGKTIGGEPVIVDLARMPHLLVAGTTGSGKSVAINTMILSLLYRLKPEECRLIMVDPKMLELSVYDNIPHLLTPVVTDPKKAVVALKWAVREMEDRYRKMSKLGVRNIDGFNARVAEAQAKGEIISRTVQTGFDRETGEAIFAREEMDLSKLPYIVVIVDEMADLMLVAGKDIEGAIQRLAQMARAAGIHLIMATQRPSVDVITGTIKANFPTRISFQVTSKIDSRTILGEQGAEQLLGQGDMLYMAGGGRISRVHGPFVSDNEVEQVVAHLKAQGAPQYLDAITREDEDAEAGEAPLPGSMDAEEGGDLYDRAVNIVLRDRKCSTSYIQRRLSVGYNKAASLVERMEQEGVVSAPNHSGKREVLVGGGVDRGAFDIEAAE
jgi:S-DNA-T family DNA segregation ATPase FtsK/SpoIIIE